MKKRKIFISEDQIVLHEDRLWDLLWEVFDKGYSLGLTQGVEKAEMIAEINQLYATLKSAQITM